MNTVIAIVGRPNVGKSTLFNRLTQTRDAIVDSVSGVTRDRNYGKGDWNGKQFSIIDTGGYEQDFTTDENPDAFQGEIRKQVMLAIEEAHIILFVVDTQVGLMGADWEIWKLLQRTNKPRFVVGNKVDSSVHMANIGEIYELGADVVYPISANNGSGSGELLDAVALEIPDEEEQEESTLPRISIVGRPNVGKSSLVNVLLGKEQNIVTDVSGTTRDSVDVIYNKYDNEFILVDTAGIRRRSRVNDDLEYYSVLRSIRSIEQSDVCILMLDATLGIESQDMRILDIILENKKGVVVLVNKWDLIEKETSTVKEYEKKIRERTSPFVDFPIVFISVKDKQRIHKAIDQAIEVFENRQTRVSTSALNDVLLPLIAATPPPSTKGKYVKIKYVTQLPTFSPKFAFFANLPQYIKAPYRRFLENQIRKHFNFHGSTIDIILRKK